MNDMRVGDTVKLKPGGCVQGLIQAAMEHEEATRLRDRRVLCVSIVAFACAAVIAAYWVII